MLGAIVLKHLPTILYFVGGPQADKLKGVYDAFGNCWG